MILIIDFFNKVLTWISVSIINLSSDFMSECLDAKCECQLYRNRGWFIKFRNRRFFLGNFLEYKCLKVELKTKNGIFQPIQYIGSTFSYFTYYYMFCLTKIVYILNPVVVVFGVSFHLILSKLAYNQRDCGI